MLFTDWIFCFTVITGMLLSVLYNKLTVAAAITGGFVSICIYSGAQLSGVLQLATFFIAGVLVTSWKIDIKQKNGLAETQKGKRSAGQVFANAGLAAIIGLAGFVFDFKETPILIASCFAAATADTVSSELGNIYGKKYYHILNFKKSIKGPNGVISLEGTLLGIAGSCLIAIVYSCSKAWDINNILIIVTAGTIGNITDSVLGATLENKGYINNNVVNFLNTLAAVIITLCLESINT